MRSWDQYKPAKRAQHSLNPLRNWVEKEVAANDQPFEGKPEKKIVFLLGDPTMYKPFETPQVYKEICANAVGKLDGYTDFFGDVSVREELAKTLSSERWTLSKDDVILTAGGSGALYLATLALAAPGDKILMPRPTFPLVKGFADFFKIDVIFYDLSPITWQPNIEQLEELLNTHNDLKFILVNTPSNPLGSNFSPESIKAIIEVCQAHNNLPIVSDEIYEEMLYEDNFKFLTEYTTTVPVLRCSGLTKRCLVPGWRLGWLALFGQGDAFKEVKQAIRRLTNILLMPNTICQLATNEIYNQSKEIIHQRMHLLEQRFHVLKHGLHDAYGISVGETSGAMYSTIIVNCEEFKDIPDSLVFAKLLQKEENVLVFPGQLFYGKDFVRLVICGDVEIIEESCTRIKRFTLRHKI